MHPNENTSHEIHKSNFAADIYIFSLSLLFCK